VASVKFIKAADKKAEFEIILEINNRDKRNINITDFVYIISYKGSTLAKTEINKKIELKSGKTTSHPVLLSISMPDLMRVLPALFIIKKITLNACGHIKIKYLGGNLPISFNRDFELDLNTLKLNPGGN
jgi:LEA14-like dessication related protein